MGSLHWDGQIVFGPDRAEIYRRLKRLADEDLRFHTEPYADTLHHLKLTVAPGTSKPGSPEALIDELTKCSMVELGRRPDDSAYDKLVALGFDAVPALINHAQDPRFTRMERSGFINNFGPLRWRVGHVVSWILDDLAGNELQVWGLRGDVADPELVRKWWAKAQAIGEERCLLNHALPPLNQYEKQAPQLLNEVIIRVLRVKYPNRLPPIYQTILLKRIYLDSQLLVDEIGASRLTHSRKVELLTQGATNGRFAHRYPALMGLSRLDDGAFRTHLRRSLEQLPQDIEGYCYWDAPEQEVAALVRIAGDPACWDALAKATRRVSPWLRFQLIETAVRGRYEELIPPGGEQTLRVERMRFLMGLLTDTTVRGNVPQGKQVKGWEAADSDPDLEVRDYAAELLAPLVDVELPYRTERPRDTFSRLATRLLVAALAEHELAKEPVRR